MNEPNVKPALQKHRKSIPFLRVGLFSGALLTLTTAFSPAFALDLMSIFQSLTDKQATAFVATTNQTALSSALLSNQIAKTTEMQVSVESGVKLGERIVNIINENTFGRGIPFSAGCEAVIDKQVANTRTIAAKELSVLQSAQIAKDHFVSASEKRANRADNHLTNFCDITETVQGVCIPKADGLGGADTNYGEWYNKEILDSEHQQLAQSYMYNSVDPANTLDSECDKELCQELKMQERNFNALASMVHNTYLSQINDRSVLHISPSTDAVITDTIAASSPAATGPTVNPNGQPVTTLSSPAVTVTSGVASTTAPTSAPKSTSAASSTKSTGKK